MFKIISITNGGGYKYCSTIPPHPKRTSRGQYPLHRVLIENSIGRLLNKKEEVHHIDGNRNNNELNNLELMDKSSHAKIHHPEFPLVIINCKCGKILKFKRHVLKQRLKRSKFGRVSCSRKCANSRRVV